MTEREKMTAGKIYDCNDPELAASRANAHRLCKLYNDTFETQSQERKDILDELLPHRSKGVYLQGPIYFDYGSLIEMGENVYANFNFTVLDVCPVVIGDNVYMGPNVSLVSPVHPMRYQDRNLKLNARGIMSDDEYGKEILIGANCWLASNVTVCGGVHIGEGCVIGAGSVVTKDIPSDCFAAGNPCRVIRKITEDDALRLKSELF